MDLEAKILAILENAKEQIQSNLDSENVSASGRTKNAIKVVQRGSSYQLIKEAGDNAPIATTEVGREGGAVPKGFNEIILAWMNDKGIQGEIVPYKTNRPHKYSEEERSNRILAGAIAHSISKNGTKRHSNPSETIYTPVIDSAIKEIKNSLFLEVKNAIKNK